MRRNHRSLARDKPKRTPKRRFIIYCEGETETGYFNALSRRFRDWLLIESEPVGGVPMTVAQRAVEEAKRLKKSRDSFTAKDTVWAVFDRDEHPNFESAVSCCETSGVSVGRSNPCFELWLILHLELFDGPDNNVGVCARLRKLRPEYDPNSCKRCNWEELIPHLDEAEKRAEKQLEERSRDSSPYGRPSTTVGRLTAAMREAAEAFILT